MYFDAKAKQEDPRWYLVDIKLDSVFAQPVTLGEMRAMKSLDKMVLLKKGSRLSIQPVTAKEWNAIVSAGSKKP